MEPTRERGAAASGTGPPPALPQPCPTQEGRGPFPSPHGHPAAVAPPGGAACGPRPCSAREPRAGPGGEAGLRYEPRC